MSKHNTDVILNFLMPNIKLRRIPKSEVKLKHPRLFQCAFKVHCVFPPRLLQTSLHYIRQPEHLIKYKL